MYNSIKLQVTHEKFQVQDMQSRVKKLYALGELTEEQPWQSAFPGQNVWESGMVDDRFWAKYMHEE